MGQTFRGMSVCASSLSSLLPTRIRRLATCQHVRHHSLACCHRSDVEVYTSICASPFSLLSHTDQTHRSMSAWHARRHCLCFLIRISCLNGSASRYVVVLSPIYTDQTLTSISACSLFSSMQKRTGRWEVHQHVYCRSLACWNEPGA